MWLDKSSVELDLNSFKPIFGEKAKYIKLGKQVPNEFKEELKEDYIYQVSRHDDHMNSIEVAKFCLENKTKGVVEKNFIYYNPEEKKYPYYLRHNQKISYLEQMFKYDSLNIEYIFKNNTLIILLWNCLMMKLVF